LHSGDNVHYKHSDFCVQSTGQCLMQLASYKLHYTVVHKFCDLDTVFSRS